MKLKTLNFFDHFSSVKNLGIDFLRSALGRQWLCAATAFTSILRIKGRSPTERNLFSSPRRGGVTRSVESRSEADLIMHLCLGFVRFLVLGLFHGVCLFVWLLVGIQFSQISLIMKIMFVFVTAFFSIVRKYLKISTLMLS